MGVTSFQPEQYSERTAGEGKIGMPSAVPRRPLTSGQGPSIRLHYANLHCHTVT